MDIVCRSHSTDLDGFADGPIEPYIDAFKQYLIQHRYAAKEVDDSPSLRRS